MSRTADALPAAGTLYAWRHGYLLLAFTALTWGINFRTSATRDTSAARSWLSGRALPCGLKPLPIEPKIKKAGFT